MSLTVIPLKAERQNGNFVLFDEIINVLSKNKISLKNGDVIVISSKYISNSQGRIIDTTTTSISAQANYISEKFMINPIFAEVILRESAK